MDTDKAYLLGLIIGGGIWGNAEDVFRIRLPYKQWGSYEVHPQRAGQISQDVMRVVSPLFRSIYGITVSYDATIGGEWNILCEGDLSSLKEELEEYGIKCEGEVRKTANINTIVPLLVDDNLKRRFIAGLADTIGSTKKSHRRFSDEKQMISFEINGFEFNFVCALCKLLHSIKCYPDQILWNHPNFHCGSNPYDTRWKKGFKLRVYLDQYDKFGSFAFASKVMSTRQNRLLETEENVAIPCLEREVRNPSVTCVHCDENSLLLPEVIRGGHYLHNKHVCAVLNCEHAPLSEVSNILASAEYFINPFPVLTKGTTQEIEEIIEGSPLYRNREYREIECSIKWLYEKSQAGAALLWGDTEESGYPISKIILASTYLIAAATGQLNGSRPRGNKDEIINHYLLKNPDAKISCLIPDLMTPLVMRMNDNAALVGPQNPKVYKKLLSFDNDNPYKLKVRNIKEEDLR